MLLSFIISSQGNDDRIFKTVSSLKKQTNQDFETILINDDPSIEKESYDFLKDLFFENDNFVLVNNSKSQGSSFNWNTAIKLAKGKYIAFIKEGDILLPNFVEKVKGYIDKYSKPRKKIDIIQYGRQFNGLYDGVSKTYLKNNTVYNLPESKEVFAYVEPVIYGKIFRTDYLKDFRLKFRTSARFDALFLYKALGHARTLFNTKDILINNKVSILKYSAFDLANQWPHILNYYRRIGIYKDLKDEINYAYYYNLVVNFLLLVSKFDNKTLYKKALKFTQTKIDHKLASFVKNNEVFKEGKDKEFTNIMNNFNTYIKTELRKK